VIQLTSPPTGAVPPLATTAFYFDLASPQTYLVAERIERRFEDATWQPAMLDVAARPASPESERVRAQLEARARELRLPLVWPERFPAPVPIAMRVAAFAAEQGAAVAFAIAASRLAFCGGFDVEDRAIIADAAAAAGLDVKRALAAADDEARDAPCAAAGRTLRREPGATLPALRYEGHVYCGEARISAALLVHARAVVQPPSAA
jgi:2-hydroxychromene-2-carboxylate isomerase